MYQIVDSHTHIGLKSFLCRPLPEEKLKKPAFQDSLENSIESLIVQMAANHISQAVAFPYPLDEIDFDLANEYVIQAYQLYPKKIIPFVLINSHLEQWIKKGARGIKQQDILLSPQQFDVDKIYPIISEKKIPIIRHFRSGNGFSVIEQVTEITEKFPKLLLIIAHMGRGKPNTGEYVLKNIESLKEYPNVFFETSTVRDTRVIEQAVNIVGAKRIIFGTDFPFNSYLDTNPVAVELGIIQKSNLSENEKKQILGENILSLVKA